MKQQSPTSRSPLEDVLRRGDPAAIDSSLTVDERGRIRGHLSRITPARSPRAGFRWLVPAVAGALGCVGLAVTLNRVTREEPSSRTVSSASSPAPHGEATPEPAIQQIRFITPNGTQIVWLLRADE